MQDQSPLVLGGERARPRKLREGESQVGEGHKQDGDHANDGQRAANRALDSLGAQDLEGVDAQRTDAALEVPRDPVIRAPPQSKQECNHRRQPGRAGGGENNTISL